MRLFDNLFAAAPVRYTLSSEGNNPKVKRLGFLERIRHLFDQKFHVSLAEQNTKTLSTALNRLPRMSPLTAQGNSLIELVRRYEKEPKLRQILDLGASSSGLRRLGDRVKELSERAIAARLGLTREELATAPGLYELARKDRIYNYMARYNEGCQFVQGQVMVRYAGTMTSWRDVPEALKQPRDRVNGEPWPYDASGLCDRNMDVWPNEAIQPFFYADPRSWGGGYAMSLCTSTFENPRLVAGDHTWIRLYDPQGGRRPGEGAIYAVGLYRPGKGPAADPMEAPLRVKTGTVRLDYSEFWGEPITELSFRITQDQFEAIRERIELDHTTGRVPFQLVDYNCTRYALELAAIADVQIDATTSFSRLLLPRRVGGIAQRIFSILPNFLQSLVLRITGLFWNLVQVKLGATQVDPAVRRVDPRRAASFASLTDAVMSAGTRPQALPTPWRLGQEVTKRIESQRAKREANLHQQLAQALEQGNAEAEIRLRDEINEVRYWLPPENRGIRRPVSPSLGSTNSLSDLDSAGSRGRLRRAAS